MHTPRALQPPYNPTNIYKASPMSKRVYRGASAAVCTLVALRHTPIWKSAMRRILTGLAALVLPLSANAVLISVEFEGVVTSTLGTGLGFTVGDPISGTLYINDALAPTDSIPDANAGGYNNFGTNNSGFVTGFNSESPRSFDLVFVSDEAGFDQFVVNDNEFTQIDPTSARQNLLNVRAVVPVDFLTGGELVQDFELLGVPGITGLMLSRLEVTTSGGPQVTDANGAAFSVSSLRVSPSVSSLLEQLLTDSTGVGPGKSLANKVTLAQTYYAVGDIPSTCAVLQSFLDQVRAQSGKKLTTAQADALSEDAELIMSAIACE